MRNKKFVLGVILVFFLFVTPSNAQEEDTDTALWTSIGIIYEASDKWTFGLEEQLRFKDNIGAIDQYFTELSAGYAIFKNAELGVGLRYIRRNDNRGNIQGYEDRLRFQIDASYKHKLGRLSFKHRLRYQNRNELGISADEGDIARQRLRFKTAISYNIQNWKLDPKFSAELFNGFAENQESEFNKYRFTLETAYKFKQAGRIRVFYRYEDEFNITDPKAAHIIGVGYRYTIKNR